MGAYVNGVWNESVADTGQNKGQNGAYFDGNQTQYPNGPPGGGTGGTATPSTSGSGNGAGSGSGNNTGSGSGNGIKGGATYDPGRDWGFSPYGNETPDQIRAANVYDFRPGEQPQDWAKRVFQQGTADYADPALNPYLAKNPLALSPFNTWFQNRYGITAPTNELVGDLISGNSQNPSQFAASTGSMFKNGTFGPTSMQGATQNLGAINTMLKNYMAGNKAGMSPYQQTVLQRIIDNPSFAAQIFQGQVGHTMGVGANDYAGEIAQSMAQGYYNDPANMGANTTPFYTMLLRQFGMGG